jgi:hypothetical protein
MYTLHLDNLALNASLRLSEVFFIHFAFSRRGASSMAILTLEQLESVLIGAVERAQRLFAAMGRPLALYPGEIEALWDAFASYRDHLADQERSITDSGGEASDLFPVYYIYYDFSSKISWFDMAIKEKETSVVRATDEVFNQNEYQL